MPTHRATFSLRILRGSYVDVAENLTQFPRTVKKLPLEYEKINGWRCTVGNSAFILPSRNLEDSPCAIEFRHQREQTISRKLWHGVFRNTLDSSRHRGKKNGRKKEKREEGEGKKGKKGRKLNAPRFEQFPFNLAKLKYRSQPWICIIYIYRRIWQEVWKWNAKIELTVSQGKLETLYFAFKPHLTHCFIIRATYACLALSFVNTENRGWWIRRIVDYLRSYIFQKEVNTTITTTWK